MRRERETHKPTDRQQRGKKEEGEDREGRRKRSTQEKYICITHTHTHTQVYPTHIHTYTHEYTYTHTTSFSLTIHTSYTDDRFPLHLAAAEACVLAVSFLLGVSADPNSRDRWGGTPLDDTLRGGTLYHRYCAKLLQAWGGELGTYNNTKEGEAFLAQLQSISIKTVRLLISKLIGQGLDRKAPDRVSDDELQIVMSATVCTLVIAWLLHVPIHRVLS
jgi:hypothetical protein